MTIQVGYPHECPTFFCAHPQGKSTSQQVNKLVSDRSDKSDLSDAHKCKSPLAPKTFSIRGVYSTHYQVDVTQQTERTVPLVCEICNFFIGKCLTIRKKVYICRK